MGNARPGLALRELHPAAGVTSARGDSRFGSRPPKGSNRAHIDRRISPFVIPHIKFDVLLKPAGGGYR
jgi:hypothetical protein